MSWKRSLKILRDGVIEGDLTYQKTLDSSVTLKWGVDWDELLIARDIMQNFFDANREHVAEIRVETSGRSTVIVRGPQPFDLHRLFYLGSEKTGDDIGQYGEGFKVAAVCLIRDHNVEPIALSGNQVMYIRTADSKVGDTDLLPLAYDLFENSKSVDGASVILRGCSPKLRKAMRAGLSHFLYEENPLLGDKLWESRDESFALYAATTEHGHLFYRRFKRGEIPGISVVLVINKEYTTIEKLIKRDRDRNAFGDAVLKTFFQRFARSGTRGEYAAQQAIVERAKSFWGKGHQLLREIADNCGSYWRPRWSDEQAKAVFGDAYFARSTSREPTEQLEYERLQREWQKAGRQALPSYFKTFGVLNAEDYLDDLKKKASAEAKEKEQRVPSPAERESIKVLHAFMCDLVPEVAAIFNARKTSYSVADTEVVLGQLRKDRESQWDSREVFLAASVFVADFPDACAVFLHEHSHIFGQDGSRGFTDSLTDLAAKLIRHRDMLDEYEEQWTRAREDVREERGTAEAEEQEETDALAGKSADELRALLMELPPVTLRALLKSTAANGS